MFYNCVYCSSSKTILVSVRNTDFEKVQEHYCSTCRRKFTISFNEKVSVEVLAEQLLATPKLEPEPRDWAKYNSAQTQEKLLFLELLADVTSLIQQPLPNQKGRPPASLQEMAFACTTKVYECLSARRASSDLELAKRRGYLSKTPSFNSVLNYFNKEELTEVLKELIRLSSLPLAGFEETIAIDASGLSSAFYSRWSTDKGTKNHDFIKIHLACGTKTNIITAVTITEGRASDSPQFTKLLEETTENFPVKSVCADKGYSSRDNVQNAWNLGVVPFISFKMNANPTKKSSFAWRKMFHYFQGRQQEFLDCYHRRSNIETTFSMLKKKFNSRLYSRNPIAQTNEALAKVLCHNLVVLIHESKTYDFNAQKN